MAAYSRYYGSGSYFNSVLLTVTFVGYYVELVEVIVFVVKLAAVVVDVSLDTVTLFSGLFVIILAKEKFIYCVIQKMLNYIHFIPWV